jgi:Tol biopolymer transport system component
MSNHLAFIGIAPDSTSYPEKDLYVVEASTHQVRQVTHGLSINDFTWSPDGQFIALREWSLRGERISRLDMKTQHRLQLTPEADGYLPVSYCWSPDSRCIALTLQRDGRHSTTGDDMEYVEAYMQHRQAYNIFFNEYAPAYEATYALHVLDTDGHNLHRTPMVDTDVTGDLLPHQPTWSPDSTQVAYTSPGIESLV